MLLSSIQVQGFKSFADKTVLKFGSGITAVVGPNGSGKSNISDAVRWVLGEQSTKSLRGQSMEDVIFSGTETRRPHGFCEVTLNIDNTDRSLNFDNDFVAITRRYYRSHESEYLINNVSVRLKDIHELFMDTGLGRDGYSMIGQGKIDNIISSKSGERRDIFEEASGISKYRYRKIEAERKLEAAEENLVRLHDIADELELRVGPLAEQSKKAQRFIELSEAKKELEIGLWIYTLNNLKDTLRAHESKIAAAQLSYKEIEDSLAEFDRKSEQNTAFFARLTSEIEGERLKISSTNEEILKTDGIKTVLNNDIVHNNDSVNRLNEEIKQLSSSDFSAKAEIESKRNQVLLKGEKKALLEQKLKDLENKLSEMLADSESISRNIENQVRELNALASKSADKRVELVTAESTVDAILSRKDASDRIISLNNSEIKKLDSDFKSTEQLVSSIEENITSSKNTLNGYQMRLNSRESSANGCKTELDTLNLDIESKKRRVQLLKELENNMEGFQHSVKVIMNQAEIGLLRGIHGPLSKLITVDKKYSTAVETALASTIQNIVVDTEEDAKRAINYLKSNNAGRATFLPISAVRARNFRENGFENMFGFVGLASELVETDKKYSEIIKYLLGGTVVAEDIDSAMVIAKKFGFRFKVVSLDGQVLNPGGSMTGGSLVKNAGLLSRATDIKRLEEEIAIHRKNADELSLKLEQALSSVAEVKADIVSVSSEITAANEDKIRALGELKRIDDLRRNLTESVKQLTDERDSNEEKLKQLNIITTTASKEIAEIDIEKSKIQDEINKMTGGRENLNSARDAVSTEITSVKLNIIEVQKDIEATVLAADNLEETVNGRSKRLEIINYEISELDFKNQKLLQDIESSNSKIDELRDEIALSEKTIADLIEKRNETEKAGIEIRTGEREKLGLREKIGGELARLSERKEVMMREYEDVIRQLYDEYQLTRSEAEKFGIDIEKPSEARKTLANIKSKIRALGSVNVSAIEEYKEVSERYNFMSEQIDDVEKSRSELYKLINQLTVQMQEIFVEGFNRINQNFSKTFNDLFGGGTASLSLSEPDNILESGIEINVKLPGKNVPSLDGLSGGEKALIALSIYFAIMHVNAPPFCFLDEVDTALDDINVERFADYMKTSEFATQFICVTHRRGTMEVADMLYGVTMQEKGVTKLLELNVAELEKQLGEMKGA